MEAKMTYEEAVKIALKQVTVEVKPIVRGRPFFKTGHDGEFMFTGANKSYQLPYSMTTRSYVKIFDSIEEQTAFEVLLNQVPGSLNVFNRENPFWLKFSVELTKEGKTLDLSIPSLALEYKVLKANTNRIAPDWASRHRPGYEFALVNSTQVQEDEAKTASITEEAMDIFAKIRKSNSKMYNVLRLLDKNPPKEVKDNTSFLKTELIKVLDEKNKAAAKGIKTIHDFIKIANDPTFDTKVLIYDAMDAQEITLRNGIFKLAATDAVMGNSLEQAAKWLDDLMNQESKIILQQRLTTK